MNISDLFAALVFGLSIPLVLSSVIRGLGAFNTGLLTHERRFSAVSLLATLLAGPGILIDRLVDDWRSDVISRDNLMFGALAAVAWAFVYGAVALAVLVRLFG